MSDGSDQEKTEEPTSKKLADAAKKGQIARSKELGTMTVLIVSAVALLIYGKALGIGLMEIMKRLFTLNRNEAFDTTKMFAVWGEVGSPIGGALAGIFGLIVLAAFVGNILLGGYNFSWEAMAPKLSKMSPLKGFKRMFGPQAAIELIKSVLKVVLVACIAYFLLSIYFTEILHLSLESTPSNIFDALEIMAWIFLGLCCSLIVIAAIDAPYQKYNHTKQLKMTQQEVKDEFKNQEGDPQVKARIRRTQREMAQRRMLQDVPDADVIVTNPTHYAVALKYDVKISPVPIVIAKGIDHIALQIRKVGDGNQIPTVESPALARSIYYTTEIKEQIPEQLFVAVAQVLAYVFQLKQFKERKGTKPKPVSKNLPIPPKFRY